MLKPQALNKAYLGFWFGGGFWLGFCYFDFLFAWGFFNLKETKANQNHCNLRNWGTRKQGNLLKIPSGGSIDQWKSFKSQPQLSEFTHSSILKSSILIFDFAINLYFKDFISFYALLWNLAPQSFPVKVKVHSQNNIANHFFYYIFCIWFLCFSVNKHGSCYFLGCPISYLTTSKTLNRKYIMDIKSLQLNMFKVNAHNLNVGKKQQHLRAELCSRETGKIC